MYKQKQRCDGLTMERREIKEKLRDKSKYTESFWGGMDEAERSDVDACRVTQAGRAEQCEGAAKGARASSEAG